MQSVFLVWSVFPTPGLLGTNLHSFPQDLLIDIATPNWELLAPNHHVLGCASDQFGTNHGRTQNTEYGTQNTKHRTQSDLLRTNNHGWSGRLGRGGAHPLFLPTHFFLPTLLCKNWRQEGQWGKISPLSPSNLLTLPPLFVRLRFHISNALAALFLVTTTSSGQVLTG